MNTREITYGKEKATGFKIDLPGAPLLVAHGKKGFLMCGYLNIEVANKFQTAAAIVRGVQTLDDLLEKPVADVSTEAEKLGVTMGMSGKDALQKFL